jgi:hypothetical protein
MFQLHLHILAVLKVNLGAVAKFRSFSNTERYPIHSLKHCYIPQVASGRQNEPEITTRDKDINGTPM